MLEGFYSLSRKEGTQDGGEDPANGGGQRRKSFVLGPANKVTLPLRRQTKKHLMRYEITLEREIPKGLTPEKFFSLLLIEQSRVHRIPGSIWQCASTGTLEEMIRAEALMDDGPVTLAPRPEQTVDPCGASPIIVAYSHENYAVARYLITRYPVVGLEGYVRIIPKSYSRRKAEGEDEDILEDNEYNLDAWNMTGFVGCVSPYAGVTALHILVMKSAYEEVRWLLEYYRELDVKQYGQHRIGERYLEGQLPDGTYDPVHRSWNQAWKRVSRLIRGRVGGSFFDHDTSFGHYLGGSSFHFAVALNDLTMVRLLMEYICSGVTGADDFFTVDQYGNNVLHICVERTLPDMFTFLIKEAKQIIRRKMESSVEQYDHRKEYVAIVENALLRNHFTHVVNNEGHTPFTLAAATGNLEMLSLMIGGRAEHLLVTQGSLIQDLDAKYKHLLAEVMTLSKKLRTRDANLSDVSPTVHLEASVFPPFYDHSEAHFMRVRRWDVCGIESNLIELDGFDVPLRPFDVNRLNELSKKEYMAASSAFNFIEVPVEDLRYYSGAVFRKTPRLKSALEWMIIGDDSLELFGLDPVRALVAAKWESYGSYSFYFDSFAALFFAISLSAASILEKSHVVGMVAAYSLALLFVGYKFFKEAMVIRNSGLDYFSAKSIPKGAVLFKRVSVWILLLLFVFGVVAHTYSASSGQKVAIPSTTGFPTTQPTQFLSPTVRPSSNVPSSKPTSLSSGFTAIPSILALYLKYPDSTELASNREQDAEDFIVAISLLTSWLTLFYHMMVTDVGFLLIVAGHVMYYDIARVLQVFAVLIVAFGSAFTVLDVYAQDATGQRRVLNILNNFKDLTIGLLSGNFYLLDDSFVSPDLMWIFVLLTLSIVILGSLLLANLIISMMTESYRKYEAKAKLVLMRERLSIMLEEENMMSREQLKAVRSTYSVDFKDNMHADHINGPYIEIITSTTQSVY